MERQYDIVVFGASGFTGRWIVEELLTQYPDKKVCLAGRNAERTKKAVLNHSSTSAGVVREHLAKHGLESLPVIEVDAKNKAGLKEMAKQTHVVIGAAGPFLSVGQDLVEACVDAGTAYCDISGEPLFVELVYQKYHEKAKAANVPVVNCCGFDCVPSDIVVDKILKEDDSVTRIEGFLSTDATNNNTGTLFTAIESVKRMHELRALRKKSQRPRLTLDKPYKPKTMYYEKRVGAYALVFSGADSTILRHSQIERKEASGRKPVQIGLWMTSKSLIVFMVIIWVGLVIYLASRFPVIESLVRKYPSYATLGIFGDPSVEQLKTKSCQWEFFYSSDGNNKRQALMRLPDPGYAGTSIIVAACAVQLLENRKSIPSGCITSASAFGSTKLLERLLERGIRLDM